MTKPPRNLSSGRFNRVRSAIQQGWVGVAILSTGLTAAAADRSPNPFPRIVIEQRAVAAWEFPEGGPENWQLEKDIAPQSAPSAEGTWKLESTGIDPILMSPEFEATAPEVTVSLRMRKTAEGGGQIFWMGTGHPHPSEDRRTSFPTTADGNWHEYQIACPFDFPVNRIRFDPAPGPGEVEIDWIRVENRRLHPLEISEVTVSETRIEATVRNHGAEPRAVEAGGEKCEIAPDSEAGFSIPRPAAEAPLQSWVIRARSEGLPELERRTLLLNRDAAFANAIRLTGEGVNVEILPDGSAAKIGLDGGDRPVAWLAPLAMREGEPVPLTVADGGGANRVRFRGPGIERLEIGIEGGEIVFSARASFPETAVEGPVIRAFGGLEQGLLAGVEHLGKGERSSSTLDIHGPEHLRHTPDPMLLTMPLMAVVTDHGSVAMRWEDNSLQPLFATPNFFDGGPDHRMALRGREIRARIRVAKSFAGGERIEDAVLWAVRSQGGLPPVPDAPRNHAEQLDFCREGLEESVIRGEDGGWFHALVPGHRYTPEQPKFFADHLSTMFRLTGGIPEFPELVPGGSHLENGAIYFVTGRAREWLAWQRNRARQARESQQPDGSWRYGGEFREGHFEDTSSGLCARNAATLLHFAKLTGDQESREAGLKALEFLKRFRTPRGAQIWECPLHAPDILASAFAAKAYILGYELTGREEYRDLARRWALSGAPNVYQWGNRPVMRYATIATLCATHYEAPVWIGRPVQWCGIVYADALLDLAPHDETLDWRKLAEGILIAGEQQQYTEGPSRGLLADSFLLDTQRLLPFDINPCALVSLRLRLAGEAAGLEFAEAGGRRVVAPFPVRMEDGEAIIQGKAGLSYQIVLDGEQIIDVKSAGEDRVKL